MYRPSPYYSDMMYNDFMFKANYKMVVDPFRENCYLKGDTLLASLDDVIIVYNKPNAECQIKAKVSKTNSFELPENLTVEITDKKDKLIRKYEVKEVIDDYTSFIENGKWFFLDCLYKE